MVGGEFMLQLRGFQAGILVALIAGLSGCSVSKPVVLEQDSEGEMYVLQCVYATVEPACRQKAEELCPLGWTYDPTLAGPDYRPPAKEDATAIIWPIACNG